jgi:translation initiation factor IF-2
MSVEELPLQKEKVRIYALARELNMESKDLLDLCRQAGYDVKNQLSVLDPDQKDQIVQLVKRGGGGSAVAVAPPPKPAHVIPQVPTPIRVLDSRPRRPAEAPRAPSQEPTTKQPPPTQPAPAVPPAAAKMPEPPTARPAAAPAPRIPETAAPREPASARPPEAPTSRPVETPPAATPPGIAAKLPTAPPGGKVPDLPAGARSGEGATRQPRSPRVIRPTTARVVTTPLRKPILRDVKKPAEAPVQEPIRRLTKEQLTGNRPVRPEDLVPRAPAGEVVPAIEDDDLEDGGKGKSKAKAVPGRDKRREARDARARERRSRGPAVEVQGGHVVVIEDERPARSAARTARLRARQRQPATLPPKGKIALEVPISVRSMSEATGIKSMDLLFKLRDHGMLNANINTTVDPDLAQLIALEQGIEVDIKRALDTETQLLTSLQHEDAPEELQPRAPIVTVMGHVDHGKTSLLDKIRASNVVATEAGGITQVIRAWRVEHNGRPITFLDTPGHEAFTKMRARGAQVTDIAVIVVAADDGVMPQTEEAINHAKAAGVSLVVAINKVDLPSANVNRTRQQLYGLNVLPDNMGGDTPFVETSAATGKGIDDLLEAISLVAELKELKANPNRPGSGTCLEASLSEGEGVRATLLLQNGTLHRGDVILCGAAYGRVRQMYDDHGQPLQDAGPSVPVRITGLDEVPNADDPFQVVPDLAVAREVADKRKVKRQEAALAPRPAVSLENLTQAKIAELKIILKADFRGSIEAIRKELEKLHHEEVRIRILHTGIGGITESDVQLALTSPEDTIIVGFNVIPDDRAKQLAEERGVQIRQYNIIYNLTNDVRSALEGKLKPREEVVHLGRAVVRQVFKISRVGTVAGCFVTQGVIERTAKIRLSRQGVVIYPPPDRTAGLESLKRHKDDVREVRENYDCGLKIAGYDDVKVDDIIEAYRVEQVQRKL